MNDTEADTTQDPSPLCSLPDCTSPVSARGWCLRHYTRWRRYGDPLGQAPPHAQMRTTQFWAKVRRPPPENAEEGDESCWDWTGGTDNNGYGVFCVESRLERVHRVSWRLHRGDIPAGAQVVHECGNAACVRPSHLRLRLPSPPKRVRPGYRRGEAHPKAKLTQAQVREMRARYAAGGVTILALAKEFGVGFSTVQALLSGKYWKGCL